jgi:hypothetical protein
MPLLAKGMFCPALSRLNVTTPTSTSYQRGAAQPPSGYGATIPRMSPNKPFRSRQPGPSIGPMSYSGGHAPIMSPPTIPAPPIESGSYIIPGGAIIPGGGATVAPEMGPGTIPSATWLPNNRVTIESTGNIQALGQFIGESPRLIGSS